MPSGEADRLAPGHTHGEVRGHRKALPRDRGARGSEVPLLQRNQRGHPARTHLSQSWSASEPAPTTSPRDLPHFEAARNSIPMESDQLFTAERNLPMDIVIRRGSLRDAPNRQYRHKSILLDVPHADPQAQVHLRGGSEDHDGSDASTSEARKRQHYARPGHASFDERSHKLATLAVKSFGRLGVEGSNFVDQLAA